MGESSERHQNDSNSFEREDLFRLVVEAVPSAMIVIYITGKIILANVRVQNMSVMSWTSCLFPNDSVPHTFNLGVLFQNVQLASQYSRHARLAGRDCDLQCPTFRGYTTREYQLIDFL